MHHADPQQHRRRQPQLRGLLLGSCATQPLPPLPPLPSAAARSERHLRKSRRRHARLCLWLSFDALCGCTVPQVVFTRSAMVYTCSPCNDACMLCVSAAEACVVGRRSMVGRVVKHVSMFTVMHRVRLREAFGGHVWRVRDRS